MLRVPHYYIKKARTPLFNLPLSSITIKCRVWRRNMFVLPLWETSILLNVTEGQWKWKGIPLRAERWSQNCAIKSQYRSRRISRSIHHNVLHFTPGSVYFTSGQKDLRVRTSRQALDGIYRLCQDPEGCHCVSSLRDRSLTNIVLFSHPKYVPMRRWIQLLSLRYCGVR